MASLARKVRFVCVSDTHNHGPGQGWTLPKGDVLIHAGDLTNQGSYNELKKATEWLEKADFALKIVVGGNHDLSLDSDYTLEDENGWKVTPSNIEQCRELIQSLNDVVYLQHSSAEVQLPNQDKSINVFGSPYSPKREGYNWAFQYPDDQAKAIWNAIPAETDILITHTPPAGHLDESQHWQQGGCAALSRALGTLKPALHICGHCHEGRGAKVVRWAEHRGGIEAVREWIDPSIGTKRQSLLGLTGSRGGQMLDVGKETAIVNASVMAKSWGHGPKSFNKPIVVDVNI